MPGNEGGYLPAEPGRIALVRVREFDCRQAVKEGLLELLGSYPPGTYGLFDMAGNVWEWTRDWYRSVPAEARSKSCCTPVDPRGPGPDDSFDPAQPDIRIPRKVLKGGSFLFAPNYCRRYRPAARQPQMIDSTAMHIGFRCVMRGT